MIMKNNFSIFQKSFLFAVLLVFTVAIILSLPTKSTAAESHYFFSIYSEPEGATVLLDGKTTTDVVTSKTTAGSDGFCGKIDGDLSTDHTIKLTLNGKSKEVKFNGKGTALVTGSGGNCGDAKNTEFLGTINMTNAPALLDLTIPTSYKEPVITNDINSLGIPEQKSTIVPVYEVLKGQDKTGQEIYKIWKIMLNVINVFAIAVLIATGFAQILRLNVNTYGVKKVLPSMLLAIVAANFSMLFCRIFIDLANALVSVFLQGADGDASGMTGAFSSMSATVTKEEVENGAKVFWFIISQFLVMAGAILVLALSYLLFIRNWIIYFLVVLSPLAFLCMILPQTKSLFNMWWTNFTKWVFMPVVSVFWLWLGGKWFDTVAPGNTVLSFVFAGACFYMAISTPFKMGGAIMGKWGDLGKKAWGKTGGWVAEGNIQSNIQARAQAKAKTYGKIGNEAAQKRWDKISDIVGKANPQTYKRGIAERIKTNKEAAEKAVAKTKPYNKLVGPAKQIQTFNEINKEDDLGAPTGDIATRAKKFTEGIMTSSNGKLRSYSRQKMTEAASSYDVVSGGRPVDVVAREMILNDVRTTNDAALADLFKGTGIDLMEVGKAKSLANAFFRRKTSREGPVLKNAFASSAVGSTVSGPAPSNSSNSIGTIRSIAGEKADDIIKDALDLKDVSGLLHGLNPEQTREIQEKVQDIQGRITDHILDETNGIGADGLQVGFNRVNDMLKQGMSLNEANRTINQKISESSGKDSLLKTPEDKSYEQARSAIDTAIRYRKEGSIDRTSRDMGDISQQVLSAIKNQAKDSTIIQMKAETEIPKTVTQLVQSGHDHTVDEALHSSDAIDALSHQIQHLTESVADQKKIDINSDLLDFRKSTLQALVNVKNSMSPEDASKVKLSEMDIRKLSGAIGTEVKTNLSKATIKTDVQNITKINSASSQPPSSTPPTPPSNP